MSIKQISYRGQKQNEFLYTSDDDKIIIQEIDKDEIDCQVQLNFISPFNVVNNNYFYIKKSSESEFTKLQLKQSGNLDSIQVLKALLDSLREFDAQVAFDQQKYTNQNKISLYFTNQVQFYTNDYYFAKCIGVDQNSVYESVINETLQSNPNNELSFPKRIFCGIARIFNVLCYFLKEPSYIINGQKRFILLKVPYNFQPGENRIVSSESQPTFTTSQLQQGFQLQFCDENFIELPMEEQDFYYVDLFISKSKKKVAQQQIIQEDKQSQAAREQQIQQYNQEREAQAQQFVQKFKEENETKANEEFIKQNNEIQVKQKAVKQIKIIVDKVDEIYQKYSKLIKIPQEEFNAEQQQFRLDLTQYLKEINTHQKQINEYNTWQSIQNQDITRLTRLPNINNEQLQKRIVQFQQEKQQRQEQLNLGSAKDIFDTAIQRMKHQVLKYDDTIGQIKEINKFDQSTAKLKEYEQTLNLSLQNQRKLLFQIFPEDAAELEGINLLSTQQFEEEKKQFKLNTEELRQAQLNVIQDDQLKEKEMNNMVIQFEEFYKENKIKLNEDQKTNILNHYSENLRKLIPLEQQGFKFEDLSLFAANQALNKNDLQTDEQFIEIAKKIKSQTDQGILDVLELIEKTEEDAVIKKNQQHFLEQAESQLGFKITDEMLDEMSDDF